VDELAADDAEVVVEAGGLVGGVDGDILEADVVEDEALEGVVLAEAAGTAGAAHEEGVFLPVEIGFLDSLDHVAGRDDARETLFSGRVFSSPVKRFLVRLR
jgi:hypothetical protein